MVLKILLSQLGFIFVVLIILLIITIVFALIVYIKLIREILSRIDVKGVIDRLKQIKKKLKEYKEAYKNLRFSEHLTFLYALGLLFLFITKQSSYYIVAYIFLFYVSRSFIFLVRKIKS